jgi:LysR family transcriptional regulator, benzoate and cis,cis-muconate-responsive activator of ben and cat genes
VNVELRHLRYFVAVAEELNFTRAAERLHIAQQPLSAAIARLEQQLGARLLDRTTRRVTLTEAGTALLEPARAALLAADAAVDAVRSVTLGEVGDVSMGLSAGAWYGLAELFEATQEQHPGIRLRVHQQSSQPLVEAVRAGTLDLAVGLCVRVPPDIQARRLKDEPVVLVVAAGHRLAAQPTASLGDVRDETFAIDDPAEGPGYNDAVVDLCARAGFTPVTRQLQTHHDAWERAIASGDCVGLTTRCSGHATHRGVRVIAVDPPATFPLDLVWRPSPKSHLRPAVQRVIDVALGTARQHQWIA